MSTLKAHGFYIAWKVDAVDQRLAAPFPVPVGLKESVYLHEGTD